MAEFEGKTKIKIFFGFLIIMLLWMLIESILLVAIGTNLTVSNTASQLFGGVGIAVTIALIIAIGVAFGTVPLLKAAVTVGDVDTTKVVKRAAPQPSAPVAEYTNYTYASAPPLEAAAGGGVVDRLNNIFGDNDLS